MKQRSDGGRQKLALDGTQAFDQGGITVFDWTDPKQPKEIAFFDRGPVDGARMGNAGSWSVYWYNGVMISSEIGRGLDIFELTPSPAMTQNEIDAAKTVKLEYLNAQGQPRHVWPASYSLALGFSPLGDGGLAGQPAAFSGTGGEASAKPSRPRVAISRIAAITP
jgi:hypothetical protein